MNLLKNRIYPSRNFFVKIREMEKEGVIEIDGGMVRLSSKYREKYSSLKGIDDITCSYCEKNWC